MEIAKVKYSKFDNEDGVKDFIENHPSIEIIQIVAKPYEFGGVHSTMYINTVYVVFYKEFV